MGVEEEVSNILDQAKVEEKEYNWKQAVKLYVEIANIYLNNKMKEQAAKIYKILGLAYTRAANTSDNQEEYLNFTKSTIDAYKEAKSLYKQIKNKSNELECEAESYLYTGLIANSIAEGKKNIEYSYELFLESSKLFSKEDNSEDVARTLNRAAMSCYFMTCFYTKKSEILKACNNGMRIGEKAWDISKDIKNIQIIGESILAIGRLLTTETFIIPFKRDENWKKTFERYILKVDESLELVHNSEDYRALGVLYNFAGGIYSGYAIQYIEDAREQKNLADKAFEYFKQSVFFSKKTKDKDQIVFMIWNSNYMAISFRRFKYLEKRMLQDLHDIRENGKIYKGLNNISDFYRNLLPTFYYTNLAQRSFFTASQQKKYAKVSIQYAKKSLDTFSFLPFFTWPYQMLTWSYSQLINLTDSSEEQKEYAKLMLNYAEKANNIGQNYEGGFASAAGSSSLYRAYKTLADISTSPEEKNKYLTLAIGAHRNYIGNEVESPAGNIASQLRLGLLYQELGIITRDIEPFEQAKKAFLLVVNESRRRKFHSYTAAAYEYLAHLEDRLGNYVISSKYYEEAQNAYNKSFKAIKIKSLKNKINEKIEYLHAWNLIENAKSNHKKENHLEAKDNYKRAYEILNDLPNYNYEAPYYFAWISQEAAEELSKQEKYEETIRCYEEARKLFGTAISKLENAFKDAKQKLEKERIEKLEKLAKVRMDHCSARINLEEARILGKQGEHITAAEKFSLAASQFREICNLFKMKREQEEQKAVYYLCKAWENMELAENYEDPNKYAEAGNLFTKASNFFTDRKMKLLAAGNSAFCQALEQGTIFDKEMDVRIKAELYTKIKSMLRIASSSYRKGGFEGGADWALATSTYFDAIWHLIRADEELELNKRKEFLEIGAMYLKSAAELFGKNNYKDKEKEVFERLDMVEKEEKILISAINTIRKPSISSSTSGIIAPACPLETSLSPNLGEVRRLTEAATKIKEKREIKDIVKIKKEVKISELSAKEKQELEKIESEIKVEEQKFICVVHKGQIVGTVYICPNCKTCYCLTCAYSLKANGEKCWTCNSEINP